MLSPFAWLTVDNADEGAHRVLEARGDAWVRLGFEVEDLEGRRLQAVWPALAPNEPIEELLAALQDGKPWQRVVRPGGNAGPRALLALASSLPNERARLGLAVLPEAEALAAFGLERVLSVASDQRALPEPASIDRPKLHAHLKRHAAGQASRVVYREAGHAKRRWWLDRADEGGERSLLDLGRLWALTTPSLEHLSGWRGNPAQPGAAGVTTVLCTPGGKAVAALGPQARRFPPGSPLNSVALNDLIDELLAGEGRAAATGVRFEGSDPAASGAPPHSARAELLDDGLVALTLEPTGPLAASREAALLETLAADAGLPFLVLDAEGTVEAVARVAEPWLAVAIPRAVGETAEDVLGGTLAEREAIRAALARLADADEAPRVRAMSGASFKLQRLAAPHGGVLVTVTPPAPPNHPAAQPEADELYALLAAAADALLAVNLDGDIVMALGDVTGLLGLPATQARSLRLDALLEPVGLEGELSAILSEAMAAGNGSITLRRRRGGGNVEAAVRPASLPGNALMALTLRDTTATRQTEEALSSLVYTDQLTGLPNLTLFRDRASKALDDARRLGTPVAALVINVDRFKPLNVTLGMHKGDELLKAVAERLGSALGPKDTLARLGADEFVALVEGLARDELMALASRLQERARKPVPINGHELNLEVSVGVALARPDADDADVLLRNAGIALDESRRQGPGGFKLFSGEMTKAPFAKLTLERRLRDAIAKRELVLHFQPQVAARGGGVIGAEALVRWEHPELGMVSPGEFIPLAEETGLIIPLGKEVLRMACREAARWPREGRAPLRVAVNISAAQFGRGDLTALVRDTLQEQGVPPERLELELTESVVMQDPEEAAKRLGELSALGVSVAVDDFGTGYSSLAYLKRFPIRSLKIDRSFVRDVDTDQNSAAIAQGVIGLAQGLRIKTVAEGVETQAQREAMAAFGCDELQGYLTGRPMPAPEFLEWLDKHKDGA